MPQLVEIGKSYFLTMANFLFHPIFWLVMVLIIIQYRRVAKLEASFFGQARTPLIYQVATSLLFGTIGGFVGSLLLSGVGVALSPTWTVYVLVLSFGLAIFVDPRLMCFAYSGGALSLSSLLFGWPRIDVPSLLGLVALLHMVESILMLISGHLGASPVCVQHKSGKLIGAYSLQKFWPVPLLALVFMPELASGGAGGIPMPEWWPLIKPAGTANLQDLTLWLYPVVAGLGYGELAITMHPRKKVRLSALNLLFYSLVLLALTLLGTRQQLFLWLGAVFAPLGHEFLVFVSNLREQEGEPLFINDGPGVMIMETLPGKNAERAGLQARDIILAVNGQDVNSIAELRDAISVAEYDVSLLLKRENREMIVHLPKAGKGESQLGAMLVPDDGTDSWLENKFSSPLERLLGVWRRTR